MSYKLLALVCFLISIASVALAVSWTHEKEDSVRGGVLAVGLALAVLFLRQDYGADVNQAVDIVDESGEIQRKLNPPEDDDKTAPQQLEDFSLHEASLILRGILGRLNVDGDSQDDQDFWLFISTAIGTIFAAFGDLFFKLICWLLTRNLGSSSIR